MGVTRAFFHCVGTVQLSMEFWKNFASGSLNGSASSLSTLVDIWSGPDALWGFSSFSSFCTPSAVTFIFGIVGAWLGPFETMTGISSFVKKEQYCLLSTLAFPATSAIRTPSDLRGAIVHESFFFDFTYVQKCLVALVLSSSEESISKMLFRYSLCAFLMYLWQWARWVR